jgi:hypothetical protein
MVWLVLLIGIVMVSCICIIVGYHYLFAQSTIIPPTITVINTPQITLEQHQPFLPSATQLQPLNTSSSAPNSPIATRPTQSEIKGLPKWKGTEV